MADTRTMVAHLVTDDAMVAGRRAGRYIGVCGTVVLPGSLTDEINRFCRPCHAVSGRAAPPVTNRLVLLRRVGQARYGG